MHPHPSPPPQESEGEDAEASRVTVQQETKGGKVLAKQSRVRLHEVSAGEGGGGG